MKFLSLSMALAGLLLAAPAPAEARTGSVTLNVPHIQQEASQLCWAALITQVLFQNPAGARPKQCDLVNRLNEIMANGAADCCGNLDRPDCNISATNRDIISLITLFGMKAEQVNVPATPEDVHEYLKSGRVLLVGVRTTPTDNHIYLVRGLVWENDKAMLIINDPYYGASAKTPFTEAQPTWLQAIAVG